MEIITGAINWQHAQWLGQYYPQDLPTDWQLDFYANEFDAILISYSVCHSLVKDELSGLLGDLPEKFIVFFEVNDLAQQEYVNNLLLPEQENLFQVEFSAESFSREGSCCAINVGRIVRSTKNTKNTVVLKVSAEHVINIEEIRGIIERVQEEYSDYELVYLFYDQALLDIQVVSQTKIIVDLLTV